ncbi:Uncharacterised protein [Chromobacterium vaccinii]|nr:Uncharacterised protein [Chromobacterium vaccinii]
MYQRKIEPLGFYKQKQRLARLPLSTSSTATILKGGMGSLIQSWRIYIFLSYKVH